VKLIYKEKNINFQSINIIVVYNQGVKKTTIKIMHRNVVIDLIIL